MKVISLNVGLPREIEWRGETFATGIFKEPTAGVVMLRKLDFDGDAQADLEVHGGVDKAAYAYPGEHYAYWRSKLGITDLPPGSFGENLTTEGLEESDVRLGDQFQVGDAEVEVSQPRLPCYKLAAKFGSEEIVRLFLECDFSGFYFRVLREGPVQAGHPIARVFSDPLAVTIRDLNRFYRGADRNPEIAERALASPALATSWRGMLSRRLNGG